MPKQLYHVETFPAHRGTAGAANQIKPLRIAVEAIGADFLPDSTYISGPVLFASVMATPDQAETMRTWPMVKSLYQRGVLPRLPRLTGEEQQRGGQAR